MKKNSYIKNLVKILATSFILLSLNSSVIADEFGCNTSYCLDFGGVIFGAENYTSSTSYENQNGTAPIETNSYSTSYEIMTINLLPLLNCGNGIRETGEQCDGTDLNGQTCTNFGFDSGTLACGTTCNWDTSACFNQPVTPPPPPGGGGGGPLPPKNPEDPEEPEEEPEEPIVEPENPTEEIPEEVPEPITIVSVPDLWLLPKEITPDPVYVEPEEPQEPAITPEPERIGVIDDTLFIVDELEPDAKYELIITDSSGNIEHTEEISTDEEGKFVFEHEKLLKDGEYSIEIEDEQEKITKKYQIQLTETDSIDFKVDDFANKKDVDNDFITTTDLGEISVYKTPLITGQGTPSSKIIGYFLNDNIDIVETTVDENGEFEMDIPSSLKLERQAVYLIEIYPDGSFSKDLTYVFELAEPNYCLIMVLVALAIFIILFVISRNIEETKKKKKKRKKIKWPKWLLTVLLLIIIPIHQIAPAFASIPQFIVYEGRLLDNAGNVITTAHTFRFSLWQSGDKIGTDIDGAGAINGLAANYSGWQEEQTVTPNLNGTFSFELGTNSAMPAMDYSIHKFLQVEVKVAGAANTTYELMDPSHDNGADTDDRKTMGSVPYSYVAESAQHTNDEVFALDYDNTIETAGTGSIELKFGDTLNKILSYDTDNSYFDFNDDVNIQGDITITGTVDGVDISNMQFTDIATRVKEMVFEAQYNDSITEQDGAANRGKLQIGYEDLGGTLKRNYYLWTTRQTTIQDIDIVVSTTLPNDFDSFTVTPLSVTYKTSDGVTATNKVDVALYDTTGNTVTLTGGTSLASGAWSTANITFGGAPTFTAGSPITLVIKLSTIDTGSTQVSDVIFEYNGR